ncbi:tetrapyrrole biosynthesis, uroporphyrinogen III synthase [Gongronella butleri]|nr:tetrapyrrole biosynthesis, uroporphyrinogen III synthase [Gongronella butleri]
MRLYFFKSESQDYQDAALHLDYEPIFIPVLDEQYTHDKLQRALELGPRTRFCGLVLTSQRSVTTLVNAWRPLSKDQRAPWCRVPLFVVGEKTAAALREAWPDWHGDNLTVADRASDLVDNIIFATMNGKLAWDMADKAEKGPTPYFLFLAGDKRRDVLPSRLADLGFDMEEVQTYATVCHPALQQRVNEHRDALTSPEHWIAFFSPSGVDYARNFLSLDHAKIAAIGPTTAAHLKQLGYPVLAVAARPDAAHLVQAIAAHDHASPDS